MYLLKSVTITLPDVVSSSAEAYTLPSDRTNNALIDLIKFATIAFLSLASVFISNGTDTLAPTLGFFFALAFSISTTLSNFLSTPF